MEETKTLNNIHQINKLCEYKLFHSSSTQNLLRRRNLDFLKLEPENHKKYFKSKIKIINNKKQKYYINNKNNYKLNKYKKINIVNKKETQKNNSSKCRININNAPIPVHNVKINNKIIKHNLIKRIEKKNVDLFSQNKNISCMLEKPPNIPNLYEHDYNLQNKNINISETFGELNKETVPIIFYNHLMVIENRNNFPNNKKTYFKASITHRNKKKMLTIIYYSPKQQ